MKILQVVNYAVDGAKFGGSIRARRIRDRLRQSFSNVVTLTAFPWEGGVTKTGPAVYVPSNLRQDRLGPDLDNIAPYLFFDEYFRSHEGQSQLARALGNQAFDLCIVEQPFMGRAMVEFFQASSQAMPTLIYSSHNIESIMLSEILHDGLKAPEQEINGWVQEMLGLERDFAQKADWCLAVSESDGKALERLGARGWTVVPNGAEIRPPSLRMRRKVDKLIGDRKSLLFVASGHPPNVQGFREMIGSDGTFLSPNVLITVAGSASWAIKSELASNEIESLSSRLLLLGEISEKSLSALIHQATGILIPIISGGGSNLKTAEALVSGKRIVATEFSFRGFEQFAHLPRVYLSNDSSEFQADMRTVSSFDEPELEVLSGGSEEPTMPTWENNLSALAELLWDLKAGRK